MDLGRLSYFKASSYKKNCIVYTTTYHTYAGSYINFSSWVKETMLFKPKFFLEVIKDWKTNKPRKEVLDDFKNVLVEKKILKTLNENYKIRFQFMDNGDHIFKELVQNIKHYLETED